MADLVISFVRFPILGSRGGIWRYILSISAPAGGSCSGIREGSGSVMSERTVYRILLEGCLRVKKLSEVSLSRKSISLEMASARGQVNSTFVESASTKYCCRRGSLLLVDSSNL